MTEADKHFKETCKKILEEGYSSEGTGVRTRWEDRKSGEGDPSGGYYEYDIRADVRRNG